MTSTPLELDAVYGLLGHRIRRAVVAAGRTLDPPVSVRRLADAATTARLERDDDTAGDAVMTDELELLLHHTHLPKLDAAGVLEYRPTALTVVAFDDDAFAQLRSARETLTDDPGAPVDALAVE